MGLGDLPLRDRLAVSDFAEAVRAGLSAGRKTLPPRFLYDALGSALFEAITELPWYGIPRAETALLAEHAGAALDLPDPLTLIELGPGSGKKLDLLLAHGARGRALEARLVDLSPEALGAAKERLARHAAVRVHTHAGTFEEGLAEAAGASAGRRRLVLFLGSNIGNFDAGEARAFLSRVRAALAPGDGFLLGADLVKGGEELRVAYDDPLGVTAAFDLNLLVRMNRELGAAFDLRDFAHEAYWNAAASRVEMHLVARRAVAVPIPALGMTVSFAEGETIHTESSTKYRVPELEELVRGAGFSPRCTWVDAARGFALALSAAA